MASSPCLLWATALDGVLHSDCHPQSNGLLHGVLVDLPHRTPTKGLHPKATSQQVPSFGPAVLPDIEILAQTMYPHCIEVMELDEV